MLNGRGLPINNEIADAKQDELMDTFIHLDDDRKDIFVTLGVLPSKPNAIPQRTGTTRGPFIYLWPKDKGVEPGFFGLPVLDDQESRRAFLNCVWSILNEAARNEALQDGGERIVTSLRADFQGDPDNIEHVIGHFISRETVNEKKKQTRCTRYLLAKLRERGYPQYMVKMDYVDGAKVTIDVENAKTITPIQKAALLAEMVGGSYLGEAVEYGAAWGYQRLRNVDYTVASTEAYREYLITEKIARNMLGAKRVQKMNLLLRQNRISDKKTVEMFALSIEMNSGFHDFSEHFKDGQRVNPNDKAEALETPGLGETFAFQAACGNYDAFGTTGSNGGYDQYGYYMIDAAKACASPSLAVAERTNSMLLVQQGGDAKNFSIFDNTTLVSRVRGLMLMGRSLGMNFRPEVVASHGEDFVAQYNTVELVSRTFTEEKNSLMRRQDETGDDWSSHIQALENLQDRYEAGAKVLLEKGKKYLSMTAQQIDIMEGFTKLSSRGLLSNMSVNGKVRLNHLRLVSYEESNIPQWNLTARNDKVTVFSARLNAFAPAQISEYLGDLVKITPCGDDKTVIIEIQNRDLESVQQKLTDTALANKMGLLLAGMFVVPDEKSESALSSSVEITDENHFEYDDFEPIANDIPAIKREIKLAPIQIDSLLRDVLESVAAVSDVKLEVDESDISTAEAADGRRLMLMPACHEHKKGRDAQVNGSIPIREILTKIPRNTHGLTCVIPLAESNSYGFPASIHGERRHWTLLVLQEGKWYLIDPKEKSRFYSLDTLKKFLDESETGRFSLADKDHQVIYKQFQKNDIDCGYFTSFFAKEVFDAFFCGEAFVPENIPAISSADIGETLQEHDDFLAGLKNVSGTRIAQRRQAEREVDVPVDEQNDVVVNHVFDIESPVLDEEKSDFFDEVEDNVVVVEEENNVVVVEEENNVVVVEEENNVVVVEEENNVVEETIAELINVIQQQIDNININDQNEPLLRAKACAAVVLQEIRDAEQSASKPDNQLRADCHALKDITAWLVNPVQARANQMADHAQTLIQNNDPGRSSGWKKLGHALLAVVGVVLLVAGAMALCSALGALPGTFMAAAGAWLLGFAGLGVGTTAAIATASAVTTVGVVGVAAGSYSSYGLFKPTPRERLLKAVLDPAIAVAVSP